MNDKADRMFLRVKLNEIIESVSAGFLNNNHVEYQQDYMRSEIEDFVWAMIPEPTHSKVYKDSE